MVWLRSGWDFGRSLRIFQLEPVLIRGARGENHEPAERCVERLPGGADARRGVGGSILATLGVDSVGRPHRKKKRKATDESPSGTEGSLIKPEVAEQPRVTSLGRACLRFRYTSWQRPLVIELGDTVATGPPRDGGYSSNGPALGREQ
ncbi:hypothetical protein IscW_ISCW010992 [Ixodes scapularis]|uniref:Uncharacterized protein n=1 Tax=Ixodes scapularis TaxID=6945 RepID=B7Q7I6_IXOSC|nr:hypothetical protein IscW_ISCW010992 [Ixodes scapularis]|eukprot:XP_002404075.1 hypothetical protein IscW_ISCW010992 [Ixodes scapularis]